MSARYSPWSPLWRACVVLFLAAAIGAVQGQTDARRSGFEFMAPSTQALERDDAQNPALLWVQQGADLWRTTAPTSDKACATCHKDDSMRGVARRYPAWDVATQAPVNLSQRINLCRKNHQQQTPWRAESQELLALEAWVARESRGLAIAPERDARLQAAARRGEQLYFQRIGQLNLSCYQCHDQYAGQRLGSSPIPQAHPTAYPLYRLEWQGLGSLQRRLRNCQTGVRAEPYAYGAPELVELELYLAERARGMPLESPGVRP
ncbi:MAG: sulfur oxidation c-type cytochrome SoxA [Rhodoferax sp.]|nr:sulfur oxidation c-type cytochrome SoxA [Rhodoferax sp.]